MKQLTPSILALYLGTECRWNKLPCKFIGIYEDLDVYIRLTDGRVKTVGQDMIGNTLQLCVRRLESMTEEEAAEMIGFAKLKESHSDAEFKRHPWGVEVWYTVDAGEEGSYPSGTEILFTACNASQFAYLLSKSFDLFNLIDSGLAVDRASIKQ